MDRGCLPSHLQMCKGHLYNPKYEDEVRRVERNEAQVFCIAQIDCDEALTDSAYQTWITGLANNGQTHIQVQILLDSFRWHKWSIDILIHFQIKKWIKKIITP